MLSRRNLSPAAPFMGLAPCSSCDSPSPVDGLPLVSELFALSASVASRTLFSLLSVLCKADVRLDAWPPRGEVDAWREEILIGAAAPAMPRSGGEEPKRGKERSSKSGSRRVLSRQRLVVGLPTSMGFLNHGRPRSLSGFLVVGGPKPPGVTGVESREGKRDLSL